VPDDYFTVAELAAIPVRDFQAEERQRREAVQLVED
jgi:hypothetical protein